MNAIDASGDPRYDKFCETHEKRVSVVCVKCGSQRLDQNSINTIMCYDCGNVGPWDGHRFTIRRPGVDHYDVLHAFQLNPK